MDLGKDLNRLATEISEELIAEAMGAPFCMLKVRIWPWVVSNSADARTEAVLEVLAELGCAGGSVMALGREGGEGELVVYAQLALLDEDEGALHAEIAKALRELTTWPIQVRTYWLPLVNWEKEYGDEPPAGS